MPTVLLVFDSRGGLTERLAEAVAEGVRSVPGVTLCFRRLDDTQIDDLRQCDALVLGSPNWSGVTGRLKDSMDHCGDLWETGDLAQAAELGRRVAEFTQRLFP